MEIRRVLLLLITSLLMVGCSALENMPELHPLLKHGDFYAAADAEGKIYYVNYADGELSVIGPGRTALEKYECTAPKLLATKYETSMIIEAGRQHTADMEGIALGNLYITKTEIITFNFTDLSVMDRQSLKKNGVTRINNYDNFVDKLGLLWEAVSDTAGYRVTLDIKENPVLYSDDRIVYYDGGNIYLKNVTGLNEEPVNYAEFYEQFVQVQRRAEILSQSNGLYDYLCIVFKDNLRFYSDSGQLVFTKEEL